MRELLAKSLAALTAVIVVGLAAAFSLVQNAPGRQDARLDLRGSQTPRAVAGRTAYDRNGCAGCHAIGGQGNPRSPLDGVGQRLAPDAIRDWIVASDRVRPRLSAGVVRIKQSYAALPEEELQALVDYLASLNVPTDPR
ncbi:MAG: cytochrome c [Burkholderiales bacterium]|nr:cytochrome c [Burkholderiales bacterium]